MLLHGIETRETLLVPLSYTFCFVGWIQNLAVCYGVQHYIASLVSTKNISKAKHYMYFLVDAHLSHSSLAGGEFCCAFHQPKQTDHICRNKTIYLTQTGICFEFSSSGFNLHGQVRRRTGGHWGCSNR
jgi:hypothetical protein